MNKWQIQWWSLMINWWYQSHQWPHRLVGATPQGHLPGHRQCQGGRQQRPSGGVLASFGGGAGSRGWVKCLGCMPWLSNFGMVVVFGVHDICGWCWRLWLFIQWLWFYYYWFYNGDRVVIDTKLSRWLWLLLLIDGFNFTTKFFFSF